MSDQHDFSEQVRRDHDELRHELGAVHRMLTHDEGARDDVVRELEQLKIRLILHFQDEEAGGLFDEIVAEAPRESDRADALKAEHATLAKTIHHIIKLGQEADEQHWRAELSEAYHEFSKQLMQHENSENMLLQEVFSEDIGSKD